MKIVNKWSTFGITFIVLLLLLMFASAPLVTYLVNKSLAKQNLALEIKQVTINPFTFAIDVEQLSLNHLIHKSLYPKNEEKAAPTAPQQLLSLQHFVLNLDAWQLLSGEIHIEAIDLNGINVQSEWFEQELSFAGWQPSITSESDNSKPAPSADNSQPWRLRGDSLTLEDFTLTLQAARQHNWHIKKFVLSDVSVTPEVSLPVTNKQNANKQSANHQGQEVTLTLQLESELNQQPLNVTLALSHNADTTQLTLSKLELAVQLDDFNEWLPQELQLSGQAELSVAGQFSKSSVQGHTRLGVSDITGQLTTNELAFSVPIEHPEKLANSKVTLNKLELDITTDDFSVVQKTANTTGSETFDINNLTGELFAQLAIEQLDWQLTNGDTLASIASITASDVKAVLPEQTLQLASLSLTDGVISQAQQLHSIALNNQLPDALANIEMLDLTAVRLTPDAVNIADITVKLTQAAIYKSQLLAAENWVLAEPEPESALEPKQAAQVSTPVKVVNAQTEKASSSKQKETSAIRIGRIAIASEGNITLFDHTPSEPVIQRLMLNEFWLKNLDSSLPLSASPFLLNSQLGKRSLIEISGYVFPFTEHADLNIKGKMSAVNLAPYSPYVIDAIGHKITQGQLTADFALDLKDQQIDGQVTTLLKAMELAKAATRQTVNQQKKRVSGSMIPINAAISQLTDSQGNIELTFPLTGDINQPNLGIGGLIALITEKALKEGAKSYMIQTFLPYANIISVAMLASDTLFEISMEDLPYESAQLTLQAPQLDYAKQLAAVLEQQKDAQLVICPKVINRDIEIPDDVALSSEQRSQLLAFGESRLELFTDHLIEVLGVNGERIIHCQATVEAKNKAQTRLSFTIK